MAPKIVTICGVFLVQEKGDQECQKSDFHQRKEADILFEKRKVFLSDVSKMRKT